MIPDKIPDFLGTLIRLFGIPTQPESDFLLSDLFDTRLFATRSTTNPDSPFKSNISTWNLVAKGSQITIGLEETLFKTCLLMTTYYYIVTHLQNHHLTIHNSQNTFTFSWEKMIFFYVKLKYQIYN